MATNKRFPPPTRYDPRPLHPSPIGALGVGIGAGRQGPPARPIAGNGASVQAKRGAPHAHSPVQPPSAVGPLVARGLSAPQRNGANFAPAPGLAGRPARPMQAKLALGHRGGRIIQRMEGSPRSDSDDEDAYYELKSHAVNFVNEPGYAQSPAFLRFASSETYRRNDMTFGLMVSQYETTRFGMFGKHLLDYQQVIVPRSGPPTPIDPMDEKCRVAREARGKDIGETCYAVICAKYKGQTYLIPGASAGTSYLKHAERNACENLLNKLGMQYLNAYQTDSSLLGKFFYENEIKIKYIYTEYPPCPNCVPWTDAIGAKAVYFSSMFELNHFSIYKGDRLKLLAAHLRAIDVLK